MDNPTAELWIAHDSKSNVVGLTLDNWEEISFVISDTKCVHEQEKLTEVRKAILNIAANICREDSEVREVFLKGLLQMDADKNLQS